MSWAKSKPSTLHRAHSKILGSVRCISGISSRGMGSVHESNQGTIVEDDFQLICFDIVSEPSTTAAYLTLSENQQRELQNKVWTKADRINRALHDILK